jgi:hypothetical protein
MTIEFRCPSCESKLSAKEKLAGQSRDCPKCGAPVEIPHPPPLEEAQSPEVHQFDPSIDEAGDSQIHGASDTKLPTIELPERLNRQHRYLILDKSKVVASWKNDGKGWQLMTVSGMVSAARNYEQLPARGEFTLVELKTDISDDGMHLDGLYAYELARSYALTRLQRGDDEICKAVKAPGSLNKQQKMAVRQSLRDQFMTHIWEEAEQVLEFLGNTDYHSPGVG